MTLAIHSFWWCLSWPSCKIEIMIALSTQGSGKRNGLIQWLFYFVLFLQNTLSVGRNNLGWLKKIFIIFILYTYMSVCIHLSYGFYSHNKFHDWKQLGKQSIYLILQLSGHTPPLREVRAKIWSRNQSKGPREMPFTRLFLLASPVWFLMPYKSTCPGTVPVTYINH